MEKTVLAEMDVALVTTSPAVQSMLQNMGYVPGKGLGVQLQGHPSPIEPKQRPSKVGLGFS